MKDADANACLPSWSEFTEWLKWDEGRHPDAPPFCIQVRWSSLAKASSTPYHRGRRQRDALGAS